MKMKLKAVAVAVLVLALQLFSVCTPCIAAAAGETRVEETAVSFSKTTIYADLVDPEIYAEGNTAEEISAQEKAAAATLLSKYPKVSSKGTSDAQIVSSVIQANGSDYYAYLYVYIPGGTVDALTAAFTFEAGGRTLYKAARQIDETATLIKYRVPISKSEYNACKVGDGVELTVSFFEITYHAAAAGTTNKVTYSALHQQFSGGVATSEIFFSYDASGQLIRSTIEEKLRLDVHMACERYSQTNAALWYQVNTAYFVVPKEYIDEYERIFSIAYKYRLLADVPMLVSDDKEFMEKLKDYEQIDFELQTSDWYDPLDRLIVNKITGNEVNVGPYFRFTVDDISTIDGTPYDVSEDDIWAEYNRAYEFAKKLYYGDPKFLYTYVFGSPAVGFSFDYDAWQIQYQSLTSFEYFFITDVLKLPYDLYTPETFKEREYSHVISSGDSSASESGWERFLDGRLLDRIEDDSVSIPAIQESDVLSVMKMTDAEIVDTYCIDSKYIPELREVLSNASSGDEIVFFHCIETYYYCWPPDYIILWDWFDSEMMLEDQGYYVLNTFILDFNVINLYFREGEVSVPVVHESVSFVGGLESPDSTYDEIADTPGEYINDAFDNLWDGVQKLLKVVRIVFIATVVVAIVIVVLKVIKLFRDAFGRRGGGG